MDGTFHLKILIYTPDHWNLEFYVSLYGMCNNDLFINENNFPLPRRQTGFSFFADYNVQYNT